MTRLEQRFADLKRAKKKGFIAFVTAGDPSLKDTVDIVLKLEDAGADVVELGIPFSDPLADGKINQDAASRALAAGATFGGVLECVAKIREKSQVPLFFYSYLNPLFAHGFDKAMKEAKAAGIDGMLLLDLPYEESGPYADSLRKYDVNNVSLVTPTSPPERIKNIVDHASGFVYCVSRTGVTGLQKKLDADASGVVAAARKHTTLPIALGFGISTPAHARAAAQAADAIVVGSAIVDRFDSEKHNAKGRTAAAKWVGSLVKAVKEI